MPSTVAHFCSIGCLEVSLFSSFYRLIFDNKYLIRDKRIIGEKEADNVELFCYLDQMSLVFFETKRFMLVHPSLC